MKIKKILTLVFTVLLAICLVGCGNQNTEAAVAKNIEKNTAKLDTIIQRLEDLNYEDIVIDDISPLADSTFNTTNNVNAEQTRWYAIGNGTRQYSTMPVAQNKPANNAKYVNSDKVELNQNTKSHITQNGNHNNCANGECFNTNRRNYNATRTSNYTPKYINEVSNNFTRNSLDNYLNQVQIVYNTCADCISCNAECKNQTVRLKQNIGDCKTLSGKLKDGTITLSDNEIYSCNQCLDNLSSCSLRLNSTKDNIMLKEKDVVNLKDNLTKNLEALKDAYSRLLTALESRLDYLKECNSNIDSLCDIINKTNVNYAEAEKNRSYEKDIVYEDENIEEENIQSQYENGILNSENQNYFVDNSNFNNQNTNYSSNTNRNYKTINNFEKKTNLNKMKIAI